MFVGRCIQVPAETLSAFADGELSLAEARTVQQHLRGCADCAARHAALARLDERLSGVGSLDCATLTTLLSGQADGELLPAEAVLLAGHARDCAPCGARSAAWSSLDAAIRELPAGLPSARVDAAIRALADRARGTRAGRRAPVALRGLAAVALATVIAVVSLAPQGRVPVAEVPAPETALVAAIQQVVLNPRTNTLYVLHPAEGAVAALDATTREQLALIRVGGRPTALALNEPANTILVLDAGRKTLTEIDASRNTVTATTSVPIQGTPTSLQIDSVNGKIVVTATSTAPPSAAAPASVAGTVIVIDSASGKLETTRSVAVAPRAVVLDESGERALLVSSDVTTIVDGATYRELGQLPGGVAAAFDLRGTAVAVLGAGPSGAQLTLFGASRVTLSLLGVPLALVALPEGGFAALLDAGGVGKIAEISSDGTLRSTSDVLLAGRDLTYDPRSRRYAVAGPGGVAFAAGGPVALASRAPTASPSPTPPVAAASPSPSPSASPQPSAPPVAALPASPAPAAPAAVDRPRDIVGSATLAWPGTYRLELPSRARPVVMGHAGQRLWYVDATNQLSVLDVVSGEASSIAQLPAEARIRSIEVGSRFVYAIDEATSRVYVVSLPSEKLTTLQLPFIRATGAIAVTPDDKLWFAIADSGQVLVLDPRTSRVEAANIGLYDVSELAADIAGRIWFADERRKTIGLYEPGTHTVTEYALARDGTVTALAVDGSGTLWVGTSAGELLSVRAGSLLSRRALGGPVATIAVGPDGSAWYATGGSAVRYGSVEAAASSLGPGSLSGLWVDGRGRAWLADRSSAAFYLALREGP